MTQTFSERAEAARDALYRKYNLLNETWREAERQLTKYHIPHDVWLEYRHDDTPNCDTKYYLGLSKVQGKWRICHSIFDRLAEYDIVTPITECSAQVRCFLARRIDDLRDKLIEVLNDFEKEVDEAIRQLRTSIDLHTPIPF